MATATTITDALDRGDPWGFGDAGRFVAVAVPPWPGAAPAPGPVSALPPWAPVEPGTLAGVDAPRQLETASVAAPAPPASRPASAREMWTLRFSITPQRVAMLSLCAAVVAALGFYLGLTLTGVAAALPATGEVVLSSHPAGAPVTVDGRAAGVTPLVLALSAGRRTVSVARPDAGLETLLLDVRAGERLTRHVPLVTVPPANAPTDTLPVDAGEVPADVSLVVAAPAPAGPVSGWVRVHAPFDVEVFEGGRLLGTSGTGRLLLTEGGHVLELANPSLGYRTTLAAAVAPGQTLTLTPAVPRAAVHVNASPWAEVFADGRSLGETPLANVPLPLGDQTLVFRHPDLGERTARVTVRASGVNRVAVAFTR